MNQDYYWTLIAKKLGDALDKDEQDDFNRLLEEDASFSALYRSCERIWEHTTILREKLQSSAGTEATQQMVERLKEEVRRQEDPYTQLARVFGEDASAEELHHIESLLQTDDSFRSIYKESKTLWEHTTKLGEAVQAKQSQTPTDKAIERMLGQISIFENEASELGKKLGQNADSVEETFQKIWQLSENVGNKVQQQASPQQVDNAIASMISRIEAESKVAEAKAAEPTPARQGAKTVQFKASKDSTQKTIFGGFQRIAAAAVLLLVSGFFAYQFFIANDNLKESPSYLALPDGSIVWLEKNSKLNFPDTFQGQDSRIVRLSGNAFFMVAKMPETPFIIESGVSRTEVTGTSFYLKTGLDSLEEHELVLFEGGVTFGLSRLRNPYQIYPGQVAQLNTENGDIAIEAADLSYYRRLLQEALSFRNTPFEDVLKKIGLAYNVSFTIKDEELGSRKFTASFEDKSLEEIMDRITLAMQVSFVKQEKADQDKEEQKEMNAIETYLVKRKSE